MIDFVELSPIVVLLLLNLIVLSVYVGDCVTSEVSPVTA
jgi:hypothetical protein